MLIKDSGKYKCVAKNRLDEIQSFQKIVVEGNCYSVILFDMNSYLQLFIIILFISGPKVSIIWIATIIFLIVVLVVVLIVFCRKIKHERVRFYQFIIYFVII